MGKTRVIHHHSEGISENEGWIFNKRVAALVVGAFAFVVAFGINNTAQAYFRENVSPLERGQAWLIYTILALVFAILIINLLYRFL